MVIEVELLSIAGGNRDLTAFGSGFRLDEVHFGRR